jgi:hypothetical protein
MSQDWRDLFGTIDVSASGIRGTAVRAVPPPVAPQPIAPKPAAQQIVAVTAQAVAGQTPAKGNAPANQAAYPSYWTMAQTVTASAVQFVANGAKTVSREVREERLSICKMCPQYDGTRCIQCGCFIAAKTWAPHEKCPAGKWPS